MCRFHALRAAFRRLREQIPNWKERQRWVTPLKTLFHTASKRTVRRRMDKRQAQAQGTPTEGVITRLVAKMPKLLPAVGSTFRPSTSNAAERFLGAFDRFYQAKGPFQSQASAEKHLALFLLGYVFETYSAEAAQERQGYGPRQLAGYSVEAIPLFTCSIDPTWYRCVGAWPKDTPTPPDRSLPAGQSNSESDPPRGDRPSVVCNGLTGRRIRSHAAIQRDDLRSSSLRSLYATGSW